MASLFTVAASMSGVLYYFARTTWEGMEPYVFQQHRSRAQAPLVLHGVDVGGSRFFRRPVVQRAADFAAMAHSGQVRKTRQPYVTHCIETALIVEGLLSPTEEDQRAEAAVVAALLHDVLDDTDVDVAEVEEEFGEQVASMVSKVSQLSTTNQIVRRRLRVESAQPTKEEELQLRTMILTMVGEPLVIAIKLADRLHNMRTVYALSPEKAQAVASETRRVWCSLAERLGIFALKSELEDLCFAVLQPGEYRALRRELDALWGVPTIPPQAADSMEVCLSSGEECECVIDEAGTLHLTTVSKGGTSISSSTSTSGGGGGSVDAAAALRERQLSHAAASTSTSASTSSAATDAATASTAASDGCGGGWEWLTEQQQETKELIETVLPFDATTFNIAKLRSGAAGRRGLEVLQACAQLLMREIGTESLASGLEVTVQGRLKSLYSTFKKMARKGVPLSEVYDARALRVVVDDEGGRRQGEAIAACYKLLPAVHRLFRRVAGEEDDYIAQPKASGYQSLHTAVVGPGGVPMEVQMRTTSMHSDAEYGKAAHWAYKETPGTGGAAAVLAAASGSTSGSGSSLDEGMGIETGHAILHIGPGGRLRDAVVLQSDYGGKRLLCAVSLKPRAAPDARPAPAAEYSRLVRYTEERGYFQPGQGDADVVVELFTLCSDGKFHRLDRFGHKLSTVAVPLATEPEAADVAICGAGGEAEGTPDPAPEHAVAASTAGSEMEYMNNRIRLLRSMLEWGRELGASIAAENTAGEGSALPDAGDTAAIAAWTETQLALPAVQGGQGSDVMVVVWPGGRIMRVPRGTTAGTLIQDMGLIEIQKELVPAAGDGAARLAAAIARDAAPGMLLSGAFGTGRLVNVNNRLVPEDTPLADGDYVVLSRDRQAGAMASALGAPLSSLLSERRVSHFAASSSEPATAGSGCSRIWRESRRTRLQAVGVGASGHVAAAGRRAALRTTCQALQAADYSFYQRLREGDVTEQFLWETRLLPMLGYLSADEATAVREALSLAFDAHSGQLRKSGEPFITHPVEVTRILAELRMDYESLVAGLLHDTVEDCGDVVGLEEIDFAFGPAVRRIVEGETKFSKLPTHHPEDRNSLSARNGAESGGAAAMAAASCAAEGGEVIDPKAQDLQFLFLAMTEEVRIIIVKLADRLHNMRTMGSMPPGKQRRIAQETLQVFAPLARLLGLYSIKEELEELSFKYALPAQYDAMRRTVARTWEAQRPVVDAARRELEERLDSDPYLLARVESVRVEACRKALYSTWRKLNDAGKSTKEIADIAQLRVVLTPRPTAAAASAAPTNGAYANGASNGAAAASNGSAGRGFAAVGAPPALDYGSEKQLCYHVMGLVHTFWAPIPGSMKDYIATPKPNNYQSLHTTVVPTGLDLAAALEGGDGNGGTRLRKGPVSLLFPIEVQIRTEGMDRLAENGIAVESWSSADRGRRPDGGAAEETYLSSTYGSVSASNGSSSSDSSWEEEAQADAAAQRNGSSSNGSSERRFPFNLGMLVSSLAGGGLSNGSSNGSSSNGASSSNSAAAVNGSGRANGAAAAANGAAANGAARPALSSSEPGGSALDPQVLSRRINWLKSIREWQSEFVGTLTASEFVECVTDDLLGQSVFVFTPSGEVVRLPKGATVVDFAYHIHTEMGNTMVAAKVNGKVVNADHELANAEVVEVVRYRGPVNATIIKRHQQWLDAAQTRTARHKIAKFLRQHAALAVSKGLLPPGDSSLAAQPGASAPGADADSRQVTWLIIECDDRPGLLAEVANCIARHDHNISAYSGSADVDAGLFIMEYELEGRPSSLATLCEELSCIESVASWV
ncbi:Guanosine-3, 5 -bis(diphosphate) 3 -pyrophosphohydrolase [Micractinium conductrix]|uniref:Putative GTP diphosphokinase RSH1, chloroplastic n=1 Tax=Micractinium conductrix TaxID=554055 RepID=A0A2P6VK55_9CHLO|nr:Guanosine-3, 5 -bis(diphosphate) 3 -pyrophosphohydrolase [Micractinium conductrix]|eukprot:PSC74447.1 Guanosine-3, 5 -bis(diphosphate) 3 -pyrophosphohydrolase [Micractinium conductrix]